MKPSTFLLLILAACLCVTCGGCGKLLYFILPDPPPKYQDAEFAGLAGHSVAIVVYAEPDVQYEYQNVRGTISDRLGGQLAMNVKGIRVLESTKIVRLQDEDLDWDVLDKTQLGKTLGVDYVVYLSLATYTMREAGSEYLLRGEMVADVSVYQTSLPERRARVYTINGFHVTHPPEAVPADTNRHIEAVRVLCENQFAILLAKKFYKHEVPRDDH